MLNYQPINLVRKKELDYIDNKDKYQDLIQLMVDFPEIIERPIVIFNEKAEIARPLENVINMFKQYLNEPLFIFYTTLFINNKI